jgi:glucosamine-6-phosphate isomerase
MTLKILPDSKALADFAANQILQCVQQKPNASVCLTSGETPRLTYLRLAALVKESGTDFSRVTFFALDEWVGISTKNVGSCYYFLMENLLSPLNIKRDQFQYFDGQSKNLSGVCDTVNRRLQTLGGLDLILVGVGVNGHVGLNEPGSSIHLHAHVSELEPITIEIGQKYFTEKTALRQGITMGLADLLEARTAMIIASGTKKSAIMKQALEGNVSNAVPVSLIRQHKNGWVLLDIEAASELTVQ